MKDSNLDNNIKSSQKIALEDSGIITLSFKDNLLAVDSLPGAPFRRAQIVKDTVFEIIKNNDHISRFSLLTMLPENQSLKTLSSKTRGVYAEIGGNPKLVKTAVVGGSPVLRFVARIITNTAMSSNKVRFFGSREDAVVWLLKDIPRSLSKILNKG